MKTYYIANARMPTEKAHGIQIAKMCEAFVEAGMDLTLVVPNRATDPRSIREYYKLRVDIPLIRLPALDWYGKGSFGYRVSSLSFVGSYLVFLAGKRIKGERFTLYTVDMDTFSSSALAFLGMPLFSEMHGAKRPSRLARLLLRGARGIIAVNQIVADELRKAFPDSRAEYLVEPNGVDLSIFHPLEKEECRAQLALPQQAHIILYVGRFLDWKGLEILPRAAARTSEIRWQMVGGTKEEFESLVGESVPDNVFFSGSRPYAEIPAWLGAGDVLLVIGTKRDAQSYRYTSPMKLFEYFSAKRPILASDTQALRQIVSTDEALFYEADDVEALTRAAKEAVAGGPEVAARTDAAYARSERASWCARAERITAFMKEFPIVR